MATYGESNANRSNSRLVLNRAIAYSGSYFLTWSFGMIGTGFSAANVEWPTAIRYLTNIFNPLQGFFNFVIYIFPNVMRAKSRGGDNTTWFQPEAVIESSKILTEFRKHVDNVEPFATDLTEAMRAANPDNFDKAEKDLAEFMSECGTGVSSIDSISSWVQLMSCTGLYHGSTLSTTRLGLMPEFLMWNKFDEDKFTKTDKSVVSAVTATMGGMAPGRHVFTHETKAGTEWNTDNVSSNVMEVLKKYDDKATELKTKYQEEIEQREDFREFGWILTDHCPDGFDGKQHTITTYF